MTYQKEDIGDIDKLYYRIHKTWIKDDGKIKSGAFIERGNGMSTDWEKYSIPENTRNRATSNSKLNGVVSFITGNLRKLTLTVQHTPSEDNRAHTDIKGNPKRIQDDPEIRLKLTDEFVWEIKVT